jgi:hypothetical protein
MKQFQAGKKLWRQIDLLHVHIRKMIFSAFATIIFIRTAFLKFVLIHLSTPTTKAPSQLTPLLQKIHEFGSQTSNERETA